MERIKNSFPKPAVWVAVWTICLLTVLPHGIGLSNSHRLLILATTKGIPYMVGLGMESVANQFVKEFKVETQTAEAEQEVLERLIDGRAQLGLLIMAEIVRQLPIPEARAKAGLQLVMGGHAATVLHVFVRKGLPITSIQDLRGRRVALPEPGSPAEGFARTVLNAIGLGQENIKPAFMRVEEQVKAFEVGFVDAVLMVVPVPSPMMSSPWPGKLATKKARLLSLGEAEVKKILDNDPSYSRHLIEAGTYPGQTQQVITLARKNALIASPGLSPDVVYQFVKAILDHSADFQKVCPLGVAYTGKNVLPGTSLLPLHPGAERYFREKGII
jgi:TRAP transporter TAXI family solute receptor